MGSSRSNAREQLKCKKRGTKLYESIELNKQHPLLEVLFLVNIRRLQGQRLEFEGNQNTNPKTLAPQGPS
jgi:hypothetical protein